MRIESFATRFHRQERVHCLLSSDYQQSETIDRRGLSIRAETRERCLRELILMHSTDFFGDLRQFIWLVQVENPCRFFQRDRPVRLLHTIRDFITRQA